jgi:hypothetical protein
VPNTASSQPLASLVATDAYVGRAKLAAAFTTYVGLKRYRRIRLGAAVAKAVCWLAIAVRRPAQQRVQPTPPLRHFGPEKMLVVQPVLPRQLVVFRWRG